MSLTNVRIADIVKKQYGYKLKSYSQVFISLVSLQVIAILFSLGGVGMMGSGSSSFEIEVHYYSADIVVVFTLLWGLITSILITTKAYRTDDFAFVTNRITSGLSNLLFLLTSSLIGSVTAMLSTYILKDIMYFRGMPFISNTHAFAAPTEFLLGLFTITLYVFLLSAIGYLLGTLVQFYRGFILLLPALLIGGLFITATLKTDTFFMFVYHFLITEPSLPIFIAKVIILAGAAFSLSFFLSNRMEVNS